MSFRVDVNRTQQATKRGPGLNQNFVASRSPEITDMSVAGAKGSAMQGVGGMISKFAEARQREAKNKRNALATQELRIKIGETRNDLLRNHADQAGNYRTLSQEKLLADVDEIADPEKEPELHASLTALAKLGAVDIQTAGLAIEGRADKESLSQYLGKAAQGAMVYSRGTQGRAEAVAESIAYINGLPRITSLEKQSAIDGLQRTLEEKDILSQMQSIRGATDIVTHAAGINQFQYIIDPAKRQSLINKARSMLNTFEAQRSGSASSEMIAARTIVSSSVDAIESGRMPDTMEIHDLLSLHEGKGLAATKPKDRPGVAMQYQALRREIKAAELYHSLGERIGAADSLPDLDVIVHEIEVIHETNQKFGIGGNRSRYSRLMSLVSDEIADISEFEGTVQEIAQEADTPADIDDMQEAVTQYISTLEKRGISVPNKGQITAVLTKRKTEVVAMWAKEVQEQLQTRGLNATQIKGIMSKFDDRVSHYAGLEGPKIGQLKKMAGIEMVSAIVDEALTNELAVSDEDLQALAESRAYERPGKDGRPVPAPTAWMQDFNGAGAAALVAWRKRAGGHIPTQVTDYLTNLMRGSPADRVEASRIANVIVTAHPPGPKEMERNEELQSMSAAYEATRLLEGPDRENAIAQIFNVNAAAGQPAFAPRDISPETANAFLLSKGGDGLFGRMLKNMIPGTDESAGSRLFGRNAEVGAEMLSAFVMAANFVPRSGSEELDTQYALEKAYVKVKANYGFTEIDGQNKLAHKPFSKIYGAQGGKGAEWAKNDLVRSVFDSLQASIVARKQGFISLGLERLAEATLGQGGALGVSKLFSDTRGEQEKHAVYQALVDEGRVRVSYAKGRYAELEGLDKDGNKRTTPNTYYVHIQLDSGRWINIFDTVDGAGNTQSGTFSFDKENSPEYKRWAETQEVIQKTKKKQGSPKTFSETIGAVN